MSYMHIDNLYKNQAILMFKECYAMEKIHGTSAHVLFKDGKLGFFSGGSKHESFVDLFNQRELLMKFKEMDHDDVTVYGEAYGGKLNGMSHIYGEKLKFVAFEVKVGNYWLSVPDAEDVVGKLGLEFVHYDKISTDLAEIDKCRDAPSVQAQRNGMGEKKREGIVLRPLTEMVSNNGKRIISKHKAEEFQERKKQPKVGDNLEAESKAQKIVFDWVTPMRLAHVLDTVFPNGEEPTIEKTGDVIKAMFEDIKREGEGEIVWNSLVQKKIGTATALLYKEKLREGLATY